MERQRSGKDGPVPWIGANATQSRVVTVLHHEDSQVLLGFGVRLSNSSNAPPKSSANQNVCVQHERLGSHALLRVPSPLPALPQPQLCGSSSLRVSRIHVFRYIG
jgi:hypothetical protein